MREGPAPRPLPERSRRARPAAAAPAAGRDVRGGRLGHGGARGRSPARRGPGRPRRRQDPVLRRRRSGQPPLRRLRGGAPQGLRRQVPLQRRRPGEERRGVGQRHDVRQPRARRVRRVRGGVLHRQEPVPEPQHPPRPHHAEGDRQGPRPVDGGHRPAGHRDRRAGRLPPPGRTGPRRLAAGGDGRDRRAGAPPRRRLARRARQRPRRRGRPLRLPRRDRALRDRRSGRGPRAPRHPAHRRGVERRRVRGPRRPDEPALDAGQLPREAGLGAHREPRQPRRAVHPLDHGADREGLQRRARPAAGAPQPGGRRTHPRRAHPVQRDARGDPHRPPRPVPGVDRGVRQPGPLGRRQPPHARSDRGARVHARASTSS